MTIVAGCFAVELWIAKPVLSQIVTGLVPRIDSASLYAATDEIHQSFVPGRDADVRDWFADTIGAGDAFTAALVYEYLRGASLAQMNETANRMGAWVASRVGAMPAPAGKGILHELSIVG